MWIDCSAVSQCVIFVVLLLRGKREAHIHLNSLIQNVLNQWTDFDSVLPYWFINTLLWLLVQTVVWLWVQRSRIIEFKAKRLSSDSLFLKMQLITGDCEWTTIRPSTSVTPTWGTRAVWGAAVIRWCRPSAGSCSSRLTRQTLEPTPTSSGQSWPEFSFSSCLLSQFKFSNQF